jgi:hypothetical protein
MVDTNTNIGAARETVAHVKDEASQQASQIKETVAEHAGQIAEQAQTQARTVVDEARSEIEHQVDEQGRRLGQNLHHVSSQLRSMADAAEPGLLNDVTRQLADAAGRTGGRMEEGGLQSVADDLRSFARRRPALFLVGAGLAGFFAARLLRAGVSQTSGNGSTAGGSVPTTAAIASPPAPTVPSVGSSSGMLRS